MLLEAAKKLLLRCCCRPKDFIKFLYKYENAVSLTLRSSQTQDSALEKGMEYCCNSTSTEAAVRCKAGAIFDLL
jgi:hypothetical protein